MMIHMQSKDKWNSHKKKTKYSVPENSRISIYKILRERQFETKCSYAAKFFLEYQNNEK